MSLNISIDKFFLRVRYDRMARYGPGVIDSANMTLGRGFAGGWDIDTQAFGIVAIDPIQYAVGVQATLDEGTGFDGAWQVDTQAFGLVAIDPIQYAVGTYATINGGEGYDGAWQIDTQGT